MRSRHGARPPLAEIDGGAAGEQPRGLPARSGLYGAVVEISNLEAAFVRSAVLAERKRVARDLHDVMAQELGYISSRIHWLIGEHADDSPLQKLLSSVERALDEARGRSRRSNDRSTSRSMSPLARRWRQCRWNRARLRFDLDPNVDVSQEWRDALPRIVREAVGNAVRHGHARTISLSLRNGAAVTLSIADDGDRFDVSAPRSSQSFGLTGMRERTDSLGGRFRILSSPGAGTASEIEIP